jgi:hypothetical protein
MEQDTFEEGTKLKKRNNINSVLQGGFDDLFDDLPNGETTDIASSYYHNTQTLFLQDTPRITFDLDLDPAQYGIPTDTFSTEGKTETMPFFNFETLTPPISSQPVFKFVEGERSTAYVTPEQVIHNFTLAPEQEMSTSTSLFELSMQAMNDGDSCQRPPKRRATSPIQHQNGKISSYPTPPTSDDDTPKSPRRQSHIAGINRKTGEPTLVAIYPPCFKNGIYTCPDLKCRESNVKDAKWTTKNGYKYHLIKCCLQNPNSSRSIKLRGGELKSKGSKDSILKCACGASFKSENGFKLHRESNMSTKDGRCMERGKRKENRERYRDIIHETPPILDQFYTSEIPGYMVNGSNIFGNAFGNPILGVRV